MSAEVNRRVFQRFAVNQPRLVEQQPSRVVNQLPIDAFLEALG